ncbi:hypothetical protein C8A01DRAFT_34446 [Parachaetomium inaequale]|uniref:DUF7730 domain-containing protein n=1 Tax=Parachaetomium inaequale TaxID=2588326 RepID=A0AAN6PIC0_9PEZI|nr:hypothetical protein C8A01DRAFT_34446 [Parachaetomium inaequale]
MSTENRGSVSHGLRRLFHKVRGRNSADGTGDNNAIQNELPPLPFLPAQRPRPLTPSASEQSPVTLGTLARLPAELRCRILMAAFGGRTLHLDLRLAHPRRPDDLAAPVSGHHEYEHDLGAAPLSEYYGPDEASPKTWRWYSSVCHRMEPPGSRWEHRSVRLGYPVYRYPHTDGCLRGEAMCCALWPPESAAGIQGKCRVGVMGWLLACRQAYAEAIDLLYATNTFFVESDALLDNLVCPGPATGSTNHLLLPERMAQITSLELRWEVLIFGQPSASWGERFAVAQNTEANRAKLAAHLRHLCSTFPNLRSLVLSFSDPLYNVRGVQPAYALAEIDRVLLRPIADAVARLPLSAQRKRVVVELPSNVFSELNGIKHKGLPGLELEEEQKERVVDDGRGLWLRYPLSARPSRQPRQGSPDAESESGSSDYDFYYIKQGVESLFLYWDYDGNPRSYRYEKCSMPM